MSIIDNFDSNRNLDYFNAVVNAAVVARQRNYAHDGVDIHFVKNRALLNTCATNAKSCFKLYGEGDALDLPTAYGLFCFSILKLHPLSYITKNNMEMMKNIIARAIDPGAFVDVAKIDTKLPHAPINAEVALDVFITLNVLGESGPENSVNENKFKNIDVIQTIQMSPTTRHVLTALRKYNHSARSMASYLNLYIRKFENVRSLS